MGAGFVLAFAAARAEAQNTNEVSRQPAAQRGRAKRIRLGFVTNTKNDFWSIVRYGCNSAQQNLGTVSVDFRFFTNSTAEEQDKVLNDLVAEGVDGIAVSPIDAPKQAEFLSQIAAKTLLVCVDSDAPGSKRACFIGTDNTAAGRQAGGLIKAALPNGGKIVLFVGYPNAENAIDRINGLREALKDSKVEIIDTMADATKPEVAEQNAKDALAKHADIACMVGLYSYNGPALLQAARETGNAGKVKIVCFDDENETLAGISDGGIYGTVVQMSTRIGYETINRMSRYLNGDKAALAGGSVLFRSLAVNQTLVEAVQAWRQDKLEP